MSGRVSSKRRRKVKREMFKDEIRCCVESYGDLINKTTRNTGFIRQNYNRPTRYQESQPFWHTE